ncbi:hypothetical protein Cgig2_015081 [Carnegiea gigantea]|uniref:Uncharacterized protein n=1 Tax=Carnegiea gigantea TaxID=171969 RepID=A0A9Q1GI77_9CARY|nr:hypothetical protein Cgig2_015081 [Carnegiea gigantea]
MQLETQRTNWLNLNTVDLVSFSILCHMCSPIHMYIKLYEANPSFSLYFIDMMVNIIDNLMLPENPSTRYDNCDSVLKRFLSKYLIQRVRPKAEEVKTFPQPISKLNTRIILYHVPQGDILWRFTIMGPWVSKREGNIVKDTKSKVCCLNFTTSRQYVERQCTT